MAAAAARGRGTGTPGGRAGAGSGPSTRSRGTEAGRRARARTPPRHRGDARGAADGQRRADAGDPTHARGTRAPGRGRGRRGWGAAGDDGGPSSPHNATAGGAGASGGRGREGRSGPGKRRAPRGARHRVGKTDDGRGRAFGKGRGRETPRRPGASQAPENGERERWRRGPRATARGFREASEGTWEAEVGRPGAHAGSHRPRPPAQGRSRGTRGRRPGPHGGPQATSRGSGAPTATVHATGSPENALPHTRNDAQPQHPPRASLLPFLGGPRALRPGTAPPRATAAKGGGQDTQQRRGRFRSTEGGAALRGRQGSRGGGRVSGKGQAQGNPERSRPVPPRGRRLRLARARRGHVTAQRRELPASREGHGCASLADFFHHPLLGHADDGGGSPRGVAGEGNDATARPQAPEATWSAPGAPRRAGRNALKRAQAGRAFGKGRRECPPRPRTPVPPAPRGKKAGGRGRAGVRTTPNPGARPPRTRHDGRARRSRGGRGPRAEREERSHPPWTPVPRLTRLRPGPGEHEITTSIDRQQAAAPRGLPEEQKPSEDGDRGDLLPPHRQAPRPPGGGGAGATGQPQTQRGTPDTRHGALRDRGCHGQRPGAHGMERTGVKDPPPPAHTALPRVPETGGRHRDPGHLESSTRAGAQAQADGSGSSERGQGPARPRGQARNPTRAQRPTSLRRATDGPAVFYVCLSSVCLSPKHNVSAPTWQQKMFISGKKITAPAGGDQPQVTATSRDRDTANCTQNLPHGAPPPPPHGAPRAIWSTQGNRGGGGGGEEGRYAVGGDATPPRRHASDLREETLKNHQSSPEAGTVRRPSPAALRTAPCLPPSPTPARARGGGGPRAAEAASPGIATGAGRPNGRPAHPRVAPGPTARDPPPQRASEQGEKIASDARDPHTCPQPGLSRHPRASPPGSDRSPSPGRDHGRQPSDTEGRPEDRPEPQDGRRDTPCPPPPRRPRSVRAGGGGATGGCWSTHPGGPHGLLRERGGGDSGDSGDGDTPSQLRRSNLRRAHRAPRPRRQPDARAGAALLLELGPGKPTPKLFLACRRRASGGDTLYKSGRQVAPDNRRERQRDRSGRRGRQGASDLASRPGDGGGPREHTAAHRANPRPPGAGEPWKTRPSVRPSVRARCRPERGSRSPRGAPGTTQARFR
ncbi:collagen alpha-1(III) chain-like, partial [Canis lupus familiaris]|uniref:collagen alpha-1(III) chain-like n=1 Tax=Canis lupus familiaris TaxID=9615 RepID=UPI0018F7B7A3